MLARRRRSTTTAAGALPATTDITISLDFNAGAKRLELVVRVVGAGGGSEGAGAALRAVTVYALDAGVFGSDRESCVVVSPATFSMGLSTLASATIAGAAAGGGSGPVDTSVLRVPLAPPTNIATELRVQAVVGAHVSSSTYAVIEKAYRLPRFPMFQPVSHTPALAASLPAPRGSVTFITRERAGACVRACVAAGGRSHPSSLANVSYARTLACAGRVATWIGKSFAVRPDQVPVMASGSPALEVRFLHLRTGGAVVITVASDAGGPVTIACDDMELAGEILQDLAAHMSLHELESVADFPEDFAAFRRTIVKLEECTAIRNRLTGDSAVTSGLVKTLVVQAEDARLLVDMPAMRRYYGELRTLHGELMGDYAKRLANHTALVGTLKEVNQMIQKTANLRGECGADARMTLRAHRVGGVARAFHARTRSRRGQVAHHRGMPHRHQKQCAHEHAGCHVNGQGVGVVGRPPTPGSAGSRMVCAQCAAE